MPDEHKLVVDEEELFEDDEVAVEEGDEDSHRKSVEKLEEELNNLKIALKKEREKARNKSKEDSYKIAMLEQKIQEIQSAKQEEELLAEHDEDDVITVKDLKRLLKMQEEKSRTREVANLIELSMDMARMKWDDFDEVTAELQGRMMQDRALAAEIIGPNGEYARSVGIRLYKKAKELGMGGDKEEKVSKSAEEKAKEEATKKVMKEIEKPSTTSKTTRATVAPGSKKLAELSLEEKRKLMRKGKIDIDDLNESWRSLLEKGS